MKWWIAALLLLLGCTATMQHQMSIQRHRPPISRWVLVKSDTTIFKYMDTPAIMIITNRYIRVGE